MATLINKVYDDVNVSLIPDDAAAAAGYVDGSWQTYPQLVKRFGSRIPLISITVFGNHARIADIEPGNPMTDAECPGWVKSMRAAGVYLPGPYTSVSNIDAVAGQLSAAGLARSQYALWSAHYTGQAHICGPATCGQCRTACDATQYTNRAKGQSLDETLAEDYFLSPQHVTPPPPVKEVTLNITLPVLQQGMADPVNGKRPVHRVQSLCNGLNGAGLTIDGAFGPATKTAVENFQRSFGGLGVDGIVGPDTWFALVEG